MTDPITSRFGALHLSGWISTAPDTGRDAAFLLLTSPGTDIPTQQSMPLVAEALSLDTSKAVSQPGDPDVRVEVTDDPWVRLHVGADYFTRTVSHEWADIARADGRAVLIVGYEPMPAGMTEDQYTNRVLTTGGFRIGLLPVT